MASWTERFSELANELDGDRSLPLASYVEILEEVISDLQVRRDAAREDMNR